MDKISRREFLIRGAALGLAYGSLGLISTPNILKAMTEPTPPGTLDLAIAKGGSPADNTVKAIQALGGIERFVKKGNKVVLKPNCLAANPPELASTTNPSLMEMVVKMCLQAGAREVVAVSHDPERSFQVSGINEACSTAGARVVAANSRDLYQSVPVFRGRLLQNVEIVKEILEADVFINIPIAKHHSQTDVTLSMKNLMGINWNRAYFHQNGLHQAIADLNTVIKPDLIIMDANRILLTNGPGGPGQTRDEKTVIAGTDPVAMDAYTATLFNRTAQDIQHIRYAHEFGVGEMNLDKLNIREIAVN
ncbi:MAG: DUF362 domain-containing protein [candidate division WOR-3 bacterium]|nr:MAG: DUF362 domain-containing protein [candidate division WOR-3 bacterium]